MEFEIIGKHRAMCQTATEVSKLELHQSKDGKMLTVAMEQKHRSVTLK